MCIEGGRQMCGARGRPSSPLRTKERNPTWRREKLSRSFLAYNFTSVPI